MNKASLSTIVFFSKYKQKEGLNFQGYAGDVARFVIGPKSVGPREISKAISCQMGGLAPGPATKSTSALKSELKGSQS